MARDIEDNKIYIVSNKIFYLIGCNFWFLLTSCPLLIYLFLNTSDLSVGGLLLASLPLGPAITSLFSTVNRFNKNKHTKSFADFFYFYKINFIQGLFTAAIINVLIGITYLDIEFFAVKGLENGTIIFYLISAIIFLLAMYMYPIISRVNLKMYDVIKVSIKLLYKKLPITLTNLSMVIIAMFIINKTKLTLYAMVFLPSIIAYIILLIEKGILEKIEEECKELYK